MALDPHNSTHEADSDVAALVRRAAAAEARAEHRLEAAIGDLSLVDDGRLDDRMRLLVQHVLARTVASIAAGLAGHAMRLLDGRGDDRLGARLSAAEQALAASPAPAALLRDAALMEELVAQVRADLLGERLPPRVGEPDAPSLLVRLAGVQDRVVAAAASALLAAESRRMEAAGSGVSADLPAELHHRLVWWTAAALRARAGEDAATDRALAEAAQRSLAAHDEGERVEALATRLAIAIDARPDELPPLLEEALGDRRLALFVAVTAVAAALSFEQVRSMVIEPEGDRLGIVLRAIGLDRDTVARLLLALAEADRRREVEALPQQMEVLAALPVDEARTLLAPWQLDRDFRAAIRAVARAGR